MSFKIKVIFSTKAKTPSPEEFFEDYKKVMKKEDVGVKLLGLIDLKDKAGSVAFSTEKTKNSLFFESFHESLEEKINSIQKDASLPQVLGSYKIGEILKPYAKDTYILRKRLTEFFDQVTKPAAAAPTQQADIPAKTPVKKQQSKKKKSL